jgi:hypothetical protein
MEEGQGLKRGGQMAKGKGLMAKGQFPTKSSGFEHITFYLIIKVVLPCGMG